MTDRGASPRAVLIFDLHHVSAAAQHHSAVGSNAASDGSAERSPNGSPHWYTSISPLPLSRIRPTVRTVQRPRTRSNASAERWTASSSPIADGLGQPLHIGNNFLGGVGMAPSREVRQIDE